MNPATAAMNGAVTIINATATGRGAAIAVRGGVEATWEWTDDGFQFRNSQVDDRLARTVYSHAQRMLGAQRGADVSTTNHVPAERGLKTSSGAAAAMLAAAAEAAGHPLGAESLVQEAVAVSLQAGVTITGAFDDQCAVVHGGCHLTDNTQGRIIESIAVEPWTVAIWVPDAAIPKSRVQDVDTSPVAADIADAERALQVGNVAEAMTRSGAAYTRLYEAAGLPVSSKPAEVALAHGALGAGLSGTGPSVAALFDADSAPELPPVDGGRWMITEVVQ